MVALSVAPQKIAWDSLPPEVRNRMERSPVFDRGVTEVQALVLEVRCRLQMGRVEFGRAVGLRSRPGSHGWGPGVTVYRWEAGRAVPSRVSCWGMVKLARSVPGLEGLAQRLEGLAITGRRRTGTPWGQGRAHKRTSGL